MFAVMGITGQVGKAVARELLTHGHRVRGVLRDPDKALHFQAHGVELAQADYTDAAALQAAFEGTEGVFVMIPPVFTPAPGFPETRRTVAAIREALRAALPPKAVYLSSIGADRDSGIGILEQPHILEQELGSVPIPNAFLRCGWFLENAQWDVASAKNTGVIHSFLAPTDRKFPMVSIWDIGRIAAYTLTETWTGNRYLEVQGPERYSFDDIAQSFSRLLHRPVSAAAVPREQWHSLFVAQGTPPDRTTLREEMLDAFNSGWIDFGAPGTESFRGDTAIDDALELMLGRA